MTGRTAKAKQAHSPQAVQSSPLAAALLRIAQLEHELSAERAHIARTAAALASAEPPATSILLSLDHAGALLLSIPSLTPGGHTATQLLPDSPVALSILLRILRSRYSHAIAGLRPPLGSDAAPTSADITSWLAEHKPPRLTLSDMEGI